MSDTRRRHEARSIDGLARWCQTGKKLEYTTKAAARRKIRWQRSQADCYDGHLLGEYRCGDHWHIGHRRPA